MCGWGNSHSHIFCCIDACRDVDFDVNLRENEDWNEEDIFCSYAGVY